ISPMPGTSVKHIINKCTRVHDSNLLPLKKMKRDISSWPLKLLRSLLLSVESPNFSYGTNDSSWLGRRHCDPCLCSVISNRRDGDLSYSPTMTASGRAVGGIVNKIWSG